MKHPYPVCRPSALLALLLLALAPHCRAQSIPAPSPRFPPLSPEATGDLLMARGQYEAAIDAYRRAPADAVIWNKTGVAWDHLSAVKIAKADYERALALRPDYPEALNNLGSAWFELKNYRKALGCYQRAAALNPRSAVIAANLGTAYFARHKYREGMVAYHDAFALDPSVFDNNSTQIIAGPTSATERAQQDYCLAELFAQSGMKVQAIEYLRKAFDEGFSDRNRIKTDHVFDQLRKTAEFAALMGEQKLQ